METMIAADPPKPFDPRQAPIWAIPQIGWLTRRGYVVTRFERVPDGDRAWVTVYVPNEGYYEGCIKKHDMNHPGPITLM